MKNSKRLQRGLWILAANIFIVIAAINAPHITWFTGAVMLLGAALVTFVMYFYPASCTCPPRVPWGGAKSKVPLVIEKNNE